MKTERLVVAPFLVTVRLFLCGTLLLSDTAGLLLGARHTVSETALISDVIGTGYKQSCEGQLAPQWGTAD